MAKEHLVVNGYRVPGGFSGIAVRRACELVLANPGIPQMEVLNQSVMFSGINLGNAGWITSPGPKSPATLLWDRRKEKVFRCYPNEHTPMVVGAGDMLFDEIMAQTTRQLRGAKFHPKPGDLISFYAVAGGAYATGLFLGYSFGRMRLDDPLFNTVQDIIDARPYCEFGHRVYMDIIENGTGRRVKDWLFDRITPV